MDCLFTGICIASCVLLMLTIITLLRVFSDIWLGRWINDGSGNSVRGLIYSNCVKISFANFLMVLCMILTIIKMSSIQP